MTDKSVGSSYQDHWSHRVEESIRGPTFDLEVAPTPYDQSTRLSSAKIHELCLQESLDPSDRKARNRVGYKHRKDLFDQWVKAGPGLDPDAQAAPTPSRSPFQPPLQPPLPPQLRPLLWIVSTLTIVGHVSSVISSSTLSDANPLKRPHSIAVDDNQLLVAPQPSAKKGRLDGPGCLNMYDDESGGKAVYIAISGRRDADAFPLA